MAQVYIFFEEKVGIFFIKNNLLFKCFKHTSMNLPALLLKFKPKDLTLEI